ncbi:hypothetical protein Ancab_017095 [Ancistrocladus abbreviatus]
MSTSIKKEMTQFSGTVLAGHSYMEVVKSHIPVVEDKLCKGQESKKELVYNDQTLCTAWTVDPIIVGCSPAHSECSRPLSGCPVKLKTKRASFSRKQKKSKQRGSSTKTSEKANEQGGVKARKA